MEDTQVPPPSIAGSKKEAKAAATDEAPSEAATTAAASSMSSDDEMSYTEHEKGHKYGVIWIDDRRAAAAPAIFPFISFLFSRQRLRNSSSRCRPPLTPRPARPRSQRRAHLHAVRRLVVPHPAAPPLPPLRPRRVRRVLAGAPGRRREQQPQARLRPMRRQQPRRQPAADGRRHHSRRAAARLRPRAAAAPGGRRAYVYAPPPRLRVSCIQRAARRPALCV